MGRTPAPRVDARQYLGFPAGVSSLRSFPLFQTATLSGKLPGGSLTPFWTTEDDVLLAKFTTHEVAERLDRTLSGVWDRRRFLGKTALGYAPHPCRMERVWPQTTTDHT